MKYKLVVFDMDGTILRERTIFKLAEEMGFKDKLLKIMNQNVESYKKSVEIARLLKCTSVSRFMEIFKKIPLQENMEYVLKRLREMRIKTAIITNSYQLAANHLKDMLHIDYAYSNELVIKDDHITGDIIMNNKKLTKRFEGCKIHSICKKEVLENICKKLNIKLEEAVAVGDGGNDVCMLRTAGLGIAFRGEEELRRNADVCIEDMREILKYVEGENGHKTGRGNNIT